MNKYDGGKKWGVLFSLMLKVIEIALFIVSSKWFLLVLAMPSQF